MKNLLLALGLTLAGCAALGSDVKNVNEPTLVVRVAAAPPAAIAEVKPPAPALGQIWIAGYWDYLGGQSVWRAGRWLEGKVGYEYIRARYEWDGQSWQFHLPHWKKRVTHSNALAAR